MKIKQKSMENQTQNSPTNACKMVAKSSTNSGKNLQNPAKNLRPISDTHPQRNPPQGAAVSR